MDEISTQNNRRTIRWNGFDYTSEGAYFVTICAWEKRCAFGRVLDGAMRANVYGEMVRDCWLAIPEHFPHVVLDAFQIMPNHFHGILIFGDATQNATRVGARHASPLQSPRGAPPDSLGAIIGSFKSAVTKRINAHRTAHDLPIVRVWQRNYHDRVIRNETELSHTRRYIIENPMNWAHDENYR